MAYLADEMLVLVVVGAVKVSIAGVDGRAHLQSNGNKSMNESFFFSFVWS